MKKSVALVVSLVSLIAIVFVAFFGTIPQNINEIVYINSLVVLDMDGKAIPETSGRKFLHLDFVSDPNLYDPVTETEYMQYFFTVEYNPGGTPPTYEASLFSFDVQLDVDGLPLIQPAEGDFTSGAILIKKRKNVDPSYPASLVAVSNISCAPNDGGSGTGDSLVLIVSYQ